MAQEGFEGKGVIFKNLKDCKEEIKCLRKSSQLAF